LQARHLRQVPEYGLRDSQTATDVQQQLFLVRPGSAIRVGGLDLDLQEHLQQGALVTLEPKLVQYTVEGKSFLFILGEELDGLTAHV